MLIKARHNLLKTERNIMKNALLNIPINLYFQFDLESLENPEYFALFLLSLYHDSHTTVPYILW